MTRDRELQAAADTALLGAALIAAGATQLVLAARHTVRGLRAPRATTTTPTTTTNTIPHDTPGHPTWGPK